MKVYRGYNNKTATFEPTGPELSERLLPGDFVLVDTTVYFDGGYRWLEVIADHGNMSVMPLRARLTPAHLRSTPGQFRRADVIGVKRAERVIFDRGISQVEQPFKRGHHQHARKGRHDAT